MPTISGWDIETAAYLLNIEMMGDKKMLSNLRVFTLDLGTIPSYKVGLGR